jgi:hypothetical protein
MEEPHPKARLRPVIRVFISSTFSDMRYERNALQADVFPKLEEFCHKNGFQFQAIDLRWGVSGEAGLDHRTMRICFEELRRAQEISPEPNFLVLLGNRYGWRPLPEEISHAEFGQLAAATESGGEGGSPIPGVHGKTARQVLGEWYRCDENVLLPETPETDPDRVPLNYILQPRTQDLGDGRNYTRTKDEPPRDTQDWIDVQQVLWSIINVAFPAESLQHRFKGIDWAQHVAEVNDPHHPRRAVPQVVRFQASATEQEIWCGALSAANGERHVLAFFREIANRDEFAATEVKDFFDLTDSGESDEAAPARQTALKEAIRLRLGKDAPVPIPFSRLTRGNGRTVVAASEEDRLQFCASVETRLRAIIERQIDQYWKKTTPASPDRAARELEIEQQEHASIAQERGGAKTFVGREDKLEAIRDYIQGRSTWPLVIPGASGCGKTALLARAAQEAEGGGWKVGRDGLSRLGFSEGEAQAALGFGETRATHDRQLEDGAAVIVRFIGTTPRSSDLRGLLKSLCQELRLRWPREGELPTDIKLLEVELHEQFRAATAKRPLILFLDALDQLADADGGRLLHWIPFGPLPPHVKLVVSCLDKADGDPAGQPYAELSRRQLPAENFINLDPFSEEEAGRLLFDRWLPKAGRAVSPNQRARIDQRLASECRQPIYLKLLFEEARLWRSYDAIPELGEDVPALLDQLFKRHSLKTNHGQLLVECVLGYLAASREGLAENEILEILFRDPEYKVELGRANETNRHEMPPNATRIPIAIWSRLRFDLASYLTERAATGANVLTFYHRQVAEWVQEHFAKASDQHWQPHPLLADYFRNLADPDRNQSWKGDSIRGFRELPFQLASSQSRSQLASVLGDAAFAAAKSSKGAAFDLLNDYNVASSRIDRHETGSLRTLQLKQIVRWEAERLSRYPECSLQQILLGIAALAVPDSGLRSQTSMLTEAHRGSANLRVWSLVPEHRVRFVTQAPTEADLRVENACATQAGILLRYKGGKWTEYSTDFEKIRSGITPAAYCTRIARGGGVLVLTSASTATVWNPWPDGAPRSCRLRALILAAACTCDGQFLALGGSDGSFQVRDLQHVESAPLLTGNIDGPIIAVWFVAGDSVVFVNGCGVLVHATRSGSWRISKQIATGRDCRLACGAIGDATCLVTEADVLQCYDGEGRPKWQANLPSKPFSLAFVLGENEYGATILAGLEDGTLQETDARDGRLIKTTKVSQSALQSVQCHPTAKVVVCCDSEGKVFLVSSSSPDDIEFRSWPACRRVLAARWDELANCLEALTPEGERYAIWQTTGDSEGDWRVSQLGSIEGPLDDAWMLSDGLIVALHRESDESQIWLHRPEGKDRIRSWRFWRGNSFFNRAGPIYVHTMAVSRCGTHFAAVSGFHGRKEASFSQGRIGRFSCGLRWQPREYFIDELVLSDGGEVMVITQDRGVSSKRQPARILICGTHVHTLLEEGWGGGVLGRERGGMQALFGIAISRDGRTILAIDTNHALWLFSFDPRRSDVPPIGSVRLQGIVSCNLSDSGMFCAVLQTDQAIAIYQIESGDRLTQLATVLPPGQPSHIQISEFRRRLIVAGQDFILAISFWSGDANPKPERYTP